MRVGDRRPDLEIYPAWRKDGREQIPDALSQFELILYGVRSLMIIGEVGRMRNRLY